MRNIMDNDLEIIGITSEKADLIAPLFDAYVVFAVIENGKPLGFTQLYPSFCSVSLKRSWILHDLFVVEQARGRRIPSGARKQ